MAHRAAAFRGSFRRHVTAVDHVAVLFGRDQRTRSGLTMWIGLKNNDDVGIKFGLHAEVLKDGAVVTAGQVNSFGGGSSGFNNAHLATVPLNSFERITFPTGSQLQLRLSVRNACTGSGKNSGHARLWFNDAAANSHFGATIGVPRDFFLREGFALAPTQGRGPKRTVDVQAGAKCSPFKPFGTWRSRPRH